MPDEQYGVWKLSRGVLLFSISMLLNLSKTETNKVLTMAYVTTNNEIVIRKVNITIKDAFKNYIETLKQIEISLQELGFRG